MNQPADERAAVAAAAASMLAALTLSPLVAGRTWLIVAVVAVIAVMVTGIVARQVLRVWPLVVLAQSAVLVLVLTVLFARGQALFGLLPGPAVLDRFGTLIDAALTVTRAQAPPVQSTQGIVLLLVASTGLVAIAVDLLAASVRQPALAGLPLLAVYCVPAALLPGGLPWYYFVAAASGFLLLLSADAGDRVRAWGRVLSASATSRAARRSSPEGATSLARGGRRVGVVAVLIAALVPSVVPGLGDRLIGGSSGGGPGEGDGRTIHTLNPILKLRDNLVSGDNTPLIRYSSPVKDPEPLRIVTADVYDGNVWAPRQSAIPREQRVQRGLPSPPGLTDDVRANSVETQISITRLRQKYLPLPYPTQRVDVRGRWLYDAGSLNVVGEGDDDTTLNLSYTAQHLDVRPTPQQLAAAGEPPAALSSYRRVPDKLPASIRDTAQRVAKSGSDYEQAVRLQRWFRSGGQFAYSTQAPSSAKGDGSVDAIAAFLEDKRGYCVHFASAMALMARTLGIPARVGVGFLPGDKQSDGSWRISAQDAHAWPELYFQGVGWVRFEPTPRAGDATPPSWARPPSGLLPEDVVPSASASVPSAAPSVQDVAPSRPVDEREATSSPTVRDRFADIPWRLVGAVTLVLLVAAAPLVASLLVRRRRWRRAVDGLGRTEAAWEELRERLSDLGTRWAASWTPRALQRRLITDLRLGGSEQAALGRLVADLEAARYAPPEDAPGRSRDELMSDVQLIVDAARTDVSPRTRHVARWLPPSGIRAIRDVARRADESASSAGRRVTDLGSGLRESVGAGRGKSGD